MRLSWDGLAPLVQALMACMNIGLNLVWDKVLFLVASIKKGLRAPLKGLRVDTRLVWS